MCLPHARGGAPGRVARHVGPRQPRQEGTAAHGVGQLPPEDPPFLGEAGRSPVPGARDIDPPPPTPKRLRSRPPPTVWQNGFPRPMATTSGNVVELVQLFAMPTRCVCFLEVTDLSSRPSSRNEQYHRCSQCRTDGCIDCFEVRKRSTMHRRLQRGSADGKASTTHFPAATGVGHLLHIGKRWACEEQETAGAGRTASNSATSKSEASSAGVLEAPMPNLATKMRQRMPSLAKQHAVALGAGGSAGGEKRGWGCRGEL